MIDTNDKKLKDPKTYEEQLEILKSRGMIVGNDANALHILERTNYYRLSAYVLAYKQDDDCYKDGTSIENIYSLYEFDRRFRIILMAMLEQVEIAKAKRGKADLQSLYSDSDLWHVE